MRTMQRDAGPSLPPAQLCFRILEQEKKVPSDEFNFLLYGGIVVERYLPTNGRGEIRR